MTEAERIWSEKSDEDLLDAAADLAQFTADGQRIIRAELKRRELEDPVEQAGEDGNRETGAAPGRRVRARATCRLRLLDSDLGQSGRGRGPWSADSDRSWS